MIDKLELKSSHEVVHTVYVADVESIFYCKPDDPDILTVLMKDGKRFYCDEVCPVDSLQEEPVAPKVLEDMLNAKTAAESLCISQEEHDRIVDELIYGKEPELVDVDDLPNKQEEPVSDGLEEVAFDYAESCKYDGGEKLLCVKHFKAGAEWKKNHLWKTADGDELPEIDREVVAFQETFPIDVDVPSFLKIVIAHRPNPEGYDGKSITTGQVEHYTPKTYDKGGWNIPDVKWWLDVELLKEIEL